MLFSVRSKRIKNDEVPLTDRSIFRIGVPLFLQYGSAAADGTVLSVTEDPLMGVTVVLEHEGGYETCYASLGEVRVKVGDTVTVGQPLGTVGNTALMESAIGDHLHFGVTCGGVPMDPAVFLGEK